MHISVYMQINLKNKPPEYRGLSGESWTFGKEGPVDLDEMLIQIFSRLAPFYGMVEEPGVLNGQLDEIAAFCQRVRFQAMEPHRKRGQDGM